MAWSQQAEDDSFNLVAQDGLVVVIGDGAPSAIDERSGCVVWATTEEITDDGGGTARVEATTIRYWSEDYPDGLLLSRSDGSVIRELSEPNPGSPPGAGTDPAQTLGGWTVDNGDPEKVVVRSSDGRRWHRDVSQEFDPSPVVRDGSWLVWGTADGAVFGLDTATRDVAGVVRALDLLAGP